MDTDSYRTLFLFYPPRDDMHGWGLDLTVFRDALVSGFPEADGRFRDAAGQQPWLSFRALTDDDVAYEGLASVEGRDCVGVRDSVVAEAARFVVWLRAAVVPPSAPIWFSSRAAVEAGLDEREWPVPAGADRGGVEEALRLHVRDVQAAEAAWDAGGDGS